jgi:hypothetical protein
VSNVRLKNSAQEQPLKTKEIINRTMIGLMMGNADPSTTARYDMRGEEANRKAASLLHFP